jgi:uncharacterized phage protein gp47/JayE
MRLELGSDPLRRSVEYALARAITGQSKGHYGFLRWIFRNCLPDSADADTLWRWARIFGIDQKTPTPWQGTYRFTGVDGTTVPALTEIVRSDGVTYTTDAAGDIGDDTTGILEVAVTATAAYYGTDGNNDDAQPLALVTPITDIDPSGVVVDTTHTGTDIETPEEGLERLLLRLRTPPSGGGPGDYVRWALEVDGVTRAWEFANLYGPNTVGVAFVRDNDGAGAAIIPDSTERAAMDAYLLTKVPITVTATAIVLVAVAVDVTISNLLPDTSAVEAAIETSLEDFFRREGAPDTSLALSRIDAAVSAGDGEISHDLDAPVAAVVTTSAQIPILGTVTFV